MKPELKEVKLGKEIEGNDYIFKIPKNADNIINNWLLLAEMGKGKTNFAELVGLYYGYKAYIDSDGDYGWLPIVLSPAFEWNRTQYPSLDKTNLPPNLSPEGLPVIKLSFNIAFGPNDEEERKQIDYIIGISEDEFFEEESIVDNIITLLIGYAEMSKLDYHTLYDYVDEFVDDVKKRVKTDRLNMDIVMKELNNAIRTKKKDLYRAMRGMFKILIKRGLFTKHKIEWLELIKQRKPIVISFGSLDSSEKGIYQFLGGIVFKELNKIGMIYENALHKKQRGMELTKTEEWLLKYWRIGFIIEEAVTFFPSTTSTTLKSYPCIDIFREISTQRGRKRGFKFNFIICTNLKMLFPDIRDKFKYLVTKYLNNFDIGILRDMGLNQLVIQNMQMLKVADFQFALTDLERYKEKRSLIPFTGVMYGVRQIVVYKSPCGQ